MLQDFIVGKLKTQMEQTLTEHPGPHAAADIQHLFLYTDWMRGQTFLVANWPEVTCPYQGWEFSRTLWGEPSLAFQPVTVLDFPVQFNKGPL